jgi:hypothetical protein
MPFFLWLPGLLALLCAGNLYADQAAELNVGTAVTLPRLPHDQVNITVDGVIDEAAWQQAAVIKDFRVIDPDTMVEPRWPTDLLLIYTERGLYAAFDMEQPPDTVVSVLSPRDTGTQFGDFVGLALDTSGDGKYGYWVSLAASGVKTDGTLVPESQFNREWDGAWYGETSIDERGWVAEIFIPWSQLAMPKNPDKRRISLFASRRLAAIGERWSVPALPFTITKWIQNMRPMELEGVDPRQQWSVLPYTSVTQDQVRNETKLRAGAEVFWRPSTNFQLSATVLPDFGNVESDDVVVNLSALETFFPEKRLFFQEGSDIFLTTPRSDPSRNFFPVQVVNSRRIGGAPRPPNLPEGVELSAGELNQPTELYGAVKATGQIGSMRYGLLGAAEDNVSFAAEDQKFKQSGSDYGAARLLWENSTRGGYRALGMISTLTAHSEEDAVVHGLDYHYMTATGRWKLDGQFLYSDKDSVGQGWGGLADVVFTPRRGLKFDLELEHYDNKLDINDLGFLQRNDISRAGLEVTYNQPNLHWARQLNLTGKTIYEVNGDGDTTRKGFATTTKTLLNNLGRIEASLLNFGRRTDDLESFGNGNFTIPTRWEMNVDYFSDTSRRFSYRLGFDLDEEKIEGQALKARASLSWRPSPRMKIDLLAEHIRRDGWLLHQEEQNFTSFKTKEWRPTLAIDYFFTASQQLRLSAQWIAIQASEDAFFLIPDDGGELIAVDKPPGPSDDFAISNLNVQLRYRWELAPLSDLFIVYTLSGSAGQPGDSFSTLLRSAYEDPVVEQFVVKLRYRFGS